jgi:type IV pili sensor histidine kinase/response regulator
MNMTLYSKKTALFLLALLMAGNTLASNTDTVTGRYLSIINKPSHEQQDLLSQVLQVRFPQNVQTIGDAMSYLLRYSGYSLVAESQISSALKNTLQKPLPVIDRVLGPITLREALIVLAGPAFTLSEDPLNREVNFHLKPNFSKSMHHGTARWI